MEAQLLWDSIPAPQRQPPDRAPTKQKVRRRGIEPRPLDWKSSILATELSTLSCYVLENEACDEIRTRDLLITNQVLCQLSYAGKGKWRIGVSIPVPRRC